MGTGWITHWARRRRWRGCTSAKARWPSWSPCFHLAEYRTGNARAARNGAPVVADGRRVWTAFEDIEMRADLFEELGGDFERAGAVTRGPVGSAKARLFSQREAVDFAVGWLRARGR